MDSPPERPREDDDPDGWVTGRLLSTAARLVEHAWDAHLAQWGLNHASFVVLWMLAAEPVSQRALARRLQVQDQTMSRMLAGLERGGYVTRARSGSDRRRRLVTATGAGRRALRAAQDDDVAERLVSDALSPRGVDELRRLLTTLVRRSGRA